MPDSSGGDPRGTRGFTQYFTPDDLNLNARAVGGGITSDPVRVEFMRTFTLYTNITVAQPLTVFLQSVDLDASLLLVEIQLAVISALGRTAIAFGEGTPIVPGLICKAVRFRIATAVTPTITAALFART